MSDRRSQILNGELIIPEQVLQLVNPSKDKDIDELVKEFFQHLWHNFLLEKSVNTILWFDRFNNKKLFNNLLMHLSKSGWITSTIEMDYAYILFNPSKLLKWITEEELSSIRYQYKFEKYRMKRTKSDISDMVKIGNRYERTGLIREGFMKAGNNVFKYDTKYLSIYLDYIALNVEKGLTASTKDITYQEICSELLHYYSVENAKYTLGKCISDSRGRAIFDCTHKIFNPISCKDARALLISPNPQYVSKDGWKAIYSAIAELNGYRGINYEDKVRNGQSMYLLKEKPDLTMMELTHNYDDLHELIWLERIYENIDNYNKWGEQWYVPISIDANASALQFIGILTNDYEYMKGTNLLETEEGFQDIWTRPYVSRNHVKKAITPQLYGSSKHAKDLWDKKKLEYDQIQLNKIGEDISIGIYSNACKFKDFIINNVQPKEIMTVNINDEIFDIHCNRFKWEESTQIDYYIYTSKQGLLKKVSQTYNLTPDPPQFKRFFPTLLCHNLDSQIANKISKEMDWVLSVHDSFTINPNDVTQVQTLYTDFMYDVWKRRKEILKNYFESIGITKEYEEQTHNKYFNTFSPYCLK